MALQVGCKPRGCCGQRGPKGSGGWARRLQHLQRHKPLVLAAAWGLELQVLLYKLLPYARVWKGAIAIPMLTSAAPDICCGLFGNTFAKPTFALPRTQ